MVDLVEVVEAAFLSKGIGHVEMPPKPGIHTRPNAFIHAMPAYIRSSDIAGMKWISGYPRNIERGLPYITGLLILNDPETGIPIAVMDATWITAMRTGAATAVAAKHLAREDATSLAILGCGVQGRSNLEALLTSLKHLKTIYVYDVRTLAASQFRDECKAKFNLDCCICESPHQAVRDADVIVTAGPILEHPSPVIMPSWIKEGAFLCTLDFDSYVTPQAFQEANLISADDVHQLKYYQDQGYFPRLPEQVVDLSDLVVGKTSGRLRESDRIISVNLGLALEDIATAQRIYQSARERGVGVNLPL